MFRERKEKSTRDDAYGDYLNYWHSKTDKLDKQYDQAAAMFHKDDLFKGVRIYVNGYTKPTALELKHMMMKHGGRFDNFENTRTTHTIVSTLCMAKLQKLKPDDKVVGPEWIVDSIAAGRLLPLDEYKLLNKKAEMEENYMK